MEKTIKITQNSFSIPDDLTKDDLTRVKRVTESFLAFLASKLTKNYKMSEYVEKQCKIINEI